MKKKRTSTMVLIFTFIVILGRYFNGDDIGLVLDALPDIFAEAVEEDLPEIVITIEDEPKPVVVDPVKPDTPKPTPPPTEPDFIAHPKIAKDGYAMKPHVLYFGADWCGPCRAILPEIDRLRGRGFRIYGFKDKYHKDIATAFNVHTYPTFIVVKDGKELARIIGADKIAEVEAHCERLMK